MPYNAENPNPQPENLTALYLALCDLGPDTGDFAGRLTIRRPDGAFAGEIRLTHADVERLTAAAVAIGEAANCTEEDSRPDGESYAEEFTRVQQAAEREQAARETGCRIDPAVEAELEEHYIGLDAEFLMDLAAQDPNSAVAAFDEITSDINDPGGEQG